MFSLLLLWILNFHFKIILSLYNEEELYDFSGKAISKGWRDYREGARLADTRCTETSQRNTESRAYWKIERFVAEKEKNL